MTLVKLINEANPHCGIFLAIDKQLPGEFSDNQ